MLLHRAPPVWGGSCNRNITIRDLEAATLRKLAHTHTHTLSLSTVCMQTRISHVQTHMCRHIDLDISIGRSMGISIAQYRYRKMAKGQAWV